MSSIVSFIGSWINGDKGKKILGAVLIIEIICLIFIFVDIFAIGTLGIIISFSGLFNSLGIGMYFYLLIIILQIIAVKTHNNEI